jgi:hypothetical protein
MITRRTAKFQINHTGMDYHQNKFYLPADIDLRKDPFVILRATGGVNCNFAGARLYQGVATHLTYIQLENAFNFDSEGKIWRLSDFADFAPWPSSYISFFVSNNSENFDRDLFLEIVGESV